MKKTHIFLTVVIVLLSACSFSGGDRPNRPWWRIPPFSWFGAHGDGQEVFHWQRPHTGIQKFATDHHFCMSESETFKLVPATKKWFHDLFYTEEKNLEIRADWNGKSGIWASFIPYPGAQPIMVNATRPEDDDDINYQKYVDCMVERGYTNRNYDIPEITNIYLRERQN
ncbi:MAG: hypothetical protein IJ689_07130 [Alphaproteobacteria bacterium]|nr:hypothetical protein [Alphaproteobacteria bacterium]